MKKHIVWSGTLFLGCVLFFSCSNTKPDATNTSENAVAVNTVKPVSGILQPCHWTFTVEQSNPGEATLISTARLDSGWHLYAQRNIDVGSLAMKFTYTELPDFKLTGTTEEGKPLTEYDEYLKSDVFYFEKEAVFKQKIKVSGKKDFIIEGTIDYQACLTQCLTLAEDFSFTVKGNP